MKLYDEVIASMEALLAPCPARPLPLTGPDWPEAGTENLVFRQDMAFELGGADSRTPALGATAVTERADFAPADEILLLGPDLPQIKADAPYARLALVRMAPGTEERSGALYGAVKKVEFVRYHANPVGFMTRVSLINGRESARVSRRALADGLDFGAVGRLMLRQYHKNPDIAAVRLVFITDPAFDFDALKALTRQTEKITKALDHVLTAGMTDCGSCSLQKICEEVEGMKELHFGLAQQG